MSLINDALKRARKTPLRARPVRCRRSNRSSTLAVGERRSAPGRRGFLDDRRYFFHRLGDGASFSRKRVDPANPVTTALPVKPATMPLAAPIAVAADSASSSNATQHRRFQSRRRLCLELQGIFYSPTSPTAIVDGKTVRPGDQFMQYQVKAITQEHGDTVGSDGKQIQLGMGN